jgi:hypothetical protein
MAILSKGTTYATGDQVTATNLNALVDSATFDDPADETTIEVNGGQLQIKDAGVTAAKLATDSVTTAKILAANVTAAKLATDSVETAKIKDANVTTAKLASNAVTYAKVDVATQAEMEAESGAGIATPDSMKYHPAAPKAYGVVSRVNGAATMTGAWSSGSTPTATESGSDRVITMGVTMGSANYVVVATMESSSGSLSEDRNLVIHSKTTTTFTIGNNNETSGSAINWAVFGDLA